jgi:DNA mismatch repair protein MutL
MSKINILSSKIYNRIAAGEVVERPFSVVKELVENSLDAGADTISIEIVDGGITSISIIDNGGGIEKSQLKNALLPTLVTFARKERFFNLRVP